MDSYFDGWFRAADSPDYDEVAYDMLPLESSEQEEFYEKNMNTDENSSASNNLVDQVPADRLGRFSRPQGRFSGESRTSVIMQPQFGDNSSANPRAPPSGHNNLSVLAKASASVGSSHSHSHHPSVSASGGAQSQVEMTDYNNQLYEESETMYTTREPGSNTSSVDVALPEGAPRGMPPRRDSAWHPDSSSYNNNSNASSTRTVGGLHNVVGNTESLFNTENPSGKDSNTPSVTDNNVTSMSDRCSPTSTANIMSTSDIINTGGGPPREYCNSLSSNTTNNNIAAIGRNSGNSDTLQSHGVDLFSNNSNLAQQQARPEDSINQQVVNAVGKRCDSHGSGMADTAAPPSAYDSNTMSAAGFSDVTSGQSPESITQEPSGHHLPPPSGAGAPGRSPPTDINTGLQASSQLQILAEGGHSGQSLQHLSANNGHDNDGFLISDDHGGTYNVYGENNNDYGSSDHHQRSAGNSPGTANNSVLHTPNFAQPPRAQIGFARTPSVESFGTNNSNSLALPPDTAPVGPYGVRGPAHLRAAAGAHSTSSNPGFFRGGSTVGSNTTGSNNVQPVGAHSQQNHQRRHSAAGQPMPCPPPSSYDRNSEAELFPRPSQLGGISSTIFGTGSASGGQFGNVGSGFPPPQGPSTSGSGFGIRGDHSITLKNNPTSSASSGFGGIRDNTNVSNSSKQAQSSGNLGFAAINNPPPLPPGSSFLAANNNPEPLFPQPNTNHHDHLHYNNSSVQEPASSIGFARRGSGTFGGGTFGGPALDNNNLGHNNLVPVGRRVMSPWETTGDPTSETLASSTTKVVQDLPEVMDV